MQLEPVQPLAVRREESYRPSRGWSLLGVSVTTGLIQDPCQRSANPGSRADGTANSAVPPLTARALGVLNSGRETTWTPRRQRYRRPSG